MAEDRHDPIANTAAFRAFNDSEAGGAERTRRGPGAVVYVTAVVALAAILLGVLAIAL
jgi:hypothetical protein